MLYLGTILYVSLLLINAMAVLSEDRFLARSTSLRPCTVARSAHGTLLQVGWSSAQPQPANPGFGQPYAQPYDQAAYPGAQDVGVKGRLIILISAVRTLMRSESCLRLFHGIQLMLLQYHS